MKFVYIAIVPLMVIAILEVILGEAFAGAQIQYLKYDALERDFDEKTIMFEIDTVQYGLSFIIGIITLASIVGVQIIGSGLNDASVRTVILILFYVGIWMVLSVLTANLLFLNKVVGAIVYTFLCFFYIIGVGGKLTGGE